jgi:uncharacterized membrane protein YhhN
VASRISRGLTFGGLRNFGRVDAGLLWLSITGSVGYMATWGRGPAPVGVVLKALSITPLAVLAFRVLGGMGEAAGRRPGRVRPRWHARWILTAALTLSSVGDVFLALDRRRYFTHALGVFLLAHLAYVLLFVGSWPRPPRASRRQGMLAGAVFVFGLLLTSWILPGLGRLAVPVLLYAGAITAMTVSAILAGFSRPIVVAGALSFLLSDSLIAVAGFKTGWLPAAYLIWPTYYLGQYAITLGFLQECAGDDAPSRAAPMSRRGRRPGR